MKSARGKRDAGPAHEFVTIWEFYVKPRARAEFERTYGPKGDWAHLFTQGQGFIRTVLCKDTARKGRYLTVDYWDSKNSYDRFRHQSANEYKALDRRCEALIDREAHLGSFLVIG